MLYFIAFLMRMLYAIFYSILDENALSMLLAFLVHHSVSHHEIGHWITNQRHISQAIVLKYKTIQLVLKVYMLSAINP